MNAFKITKTTHPKPKPDESRLGFGKYYTDHMLLIDYTAGIGWHDARIVPFANLELHPAAGRQSAAVPAAGERTPHEQLRPAHGAPHHG